MSKKKQSQPLMDDSAEVSTTLDDTELEATTEPGTEPEGFADASLEAVEGGSEEAEPGLSAVPNDRHWMAQETITVNQELTETEKAQYAVDMAGLDAEIERLEFERDAHMKSLKKQIDAHEEERRGLSRIVRTGKEEREIDCDKLADYNTGEIVWTAANPPHEEVQRRKMTAEELQIPLQKAEKPMPVDDSGEGEGLDAAALGLPLPDADDVTGSEDAEGTPGWELVTGTSHEESAGAVQ